MDETTVLQQSRPTRLLTTRLRIALALGFSASVFAIAIRGLRPDHAKSGWLVSPDVLLNGWPLIAVNVFIYVWVCWCGFWLIRGTAGRERFFMAGLFGHLLLWPLKMLLPQWAVAIKYVGVFLLAVALFAALALLLSPSDAAESEDRTDPAGT